MEKIELEYYVTDAGLSPFVEWIQDLKDRKGSIAIRARLTRFQAGLLGDVKSVGDGVYEARVNYGPGYRFYYTHHQNRVILLLVGGDKSTQKRDILKAKEYWFDFRQEEFNDKK